MTDIIEKQLVGKRTDMRLCEDGLFESDKQGQTEVENKRR